MVDLVSLGGLLSFPFAKVTLPDSFCPDGARRSFSSDDDIFTIGIWRTSWFGRPTCF